MARRKKFFLWSTLLVLAAVLFVWVWFAKTYYPRIAELGSPPRRAIKPYHRDFLTKDPQKSGFELWQGELVKDVPCLVMTPTGEMAEQSIWAKRLRGQLRERGVEVPRWHPRRVVVFFHGHRARKEDMLPIARNLVSLGMIGIMPDAPGHGASPLPKGAFGSGVHECDLAGQLVDAARERFSWPQMPVHLWGISMGGSFVAYNAAERPDAWASCVIVSSFDDLGGLIQPSFDQLPAGLGVPTFAAAKWASCHINWFDVSTVQPVKLLPAVKSPLLVVHGKADKLITIDRGRRLFEAAGSVEKEFVEVPEGTHSNVLVTPHQTYAKMAAWMLRHEVPRPTD